MKTKVTKTQWVATIVICAVIVISVIAVLFALFFNPQRTFTITETFRITLATDSETYLKVSLPMSGGYQEITNLLVEGAYEYTVEYFNGWRDLTVRVPSNDTEVLITVSYTARLFRNVEPWAGEILDEYTQPQQFIDSDNEAITALAAQLRGENDFQTAQNISRYVNRLISWPSGQQINVAKRYASELLENPVGVCGDFANLMVALLRAENIPARNISGLALQVPLRSANDWGHSGAAHGWVEFFADGKWHFADPSWGWFNRNATSHLSFGTFESYISSDFQQNRVIEIEEAGFSLRGGMSAPLRFLFYSTYENAVITPKGDVRFSWFR